MTTLASVCSGLVALAATLSSAPAQSASTPYYMENIGRGLVGLRTGTNNAYLSWRLLGTDDPDMRFHVYRSIGGAAPIRLTASPIAATTDYRDTPGGSAFDASIAYHVTAVLGGVEGEPSRPWAFAPGAPIRPYIPVPIQPPPGGTTPAGETYTYSANDISIGDLTGDGEYDFVVKWEPSNAKDNANSGYTGNVILDAYTIEGTLLWRIDLGRNIRAGAHYTQFIVYDLDSDGRAEVAVKTAPGTVDGLGQHVLLPGDDPNADYRNGSGYILSGPEYLTIFDGRTGANLATVPYIVSRHPGTQNPSGSQLNSVWGDNYGNRVDRFNAAVAYLDGERPSLIMARGIYTRVAVAAWDWRDGGLTLRWLFDTHNSPSLNAYRGQGNHQISIADVDGDGRQEIVYGAATIDHDGTGLYSTGLGHGDALHVGDFDPARPGLEIFSPFESPGSNGGIGTAMRAAATGEIIWSTPASGDVGRGVIMDIDPRYPGAEAWATNNSNIYAADGTVVAQKPSNMFHNFAVWWDGDLLREMLDRETISKWNWNTGGRQNLLTAWTYGAADNNGSKATPCLSGDILGDWREEVVWRKGDNTELMIFTTTVPAANRLWTFLHDPQYRIALAWQNVAYNQPPHPSFFVGAGMDDPSRPDIRTDAILPPGPPREPAEIVWTGAGSPVWRAGPDGPANWALPDVGPTFFLDGDDVLFGAAGGNSVTLEGVLAPVSVRVDRAGALTFGGAGSLTGASALTKRGAGVLTVNMVNAYGGGTFIEAGTVVIGHASALGSGPVVLRGGTYATGALSPANPVVACADSRITGGHSGGAHGIFAVSGDAVLTAETSSVFDFQGDMSGFTGRLTLAGAGYFRFFGSAGAPNADIDLGPSVSLNTRSGSAIALGSLSGAPGSTFSGSSGGGNNASVTYTIGGKATDSLFAGAITNGSNATNVTKTSSGRLTLAGANTYTGATTVNAGALLVTGSLANTVVTVESAGSLGGNGAIAGPVTCHGTLAPGADSPGALVLQSGLTLSSTAVLDFELGPASDEIQVTGNLTLDGTLNVAADPDIAPGTYTLAAYTGTLTDNGLNVGALPEGFTGSVAASDGTVRLTLDPELTPYRQWQIEHFGSADRSDAAPDADRDGDGTPNKIEFLLSLDPRDGASAFRGTISDGRKLVWPSAEGIVFTVKRSLTLNGDWETVGTVTGGPGNTASFTDPQSFDRAFYRIEFEP